MAKDRQIEFAPVGYEWRSAGQDGVSARHALDPSGNVISLRQAQNLQRAERARLGQPKAPTVQRQGRTKRIINKGLAGDNTKAGQVGSLYNPERHGRTESWVFRSFIDAQNYLITNKTPEWAKFGIIQIRFTERLVGTDRIGSDTVGVKNGYATISGFTNVEDLRDEAADEELHTDTKTGNVWLNAQDRLENYDMSGDRARVYIFLREK